MKQDPDYNFLISLWPDLKKLSDINKMRFKAEMIKYLLQLKESEVNLKHSRSSTPSWSSFQESDQVDNILTHLTSL